MDPIQAEELASNIVDIPKDMAMMQSTEGACRTGGTDTYITPFTSGEEGSSGSRRPGWGSRGRSNSRRVPL